MTRRKFVKKLLGAAAAVAVGAKWFAEKAAPRRFVRALRADRYPGSLKPLGEVLKEGKWSG
jgi:hypothetical protein